jgi:hypothetical protein
MKRAILNTLVPDQSGNKVPPFPIDRQVAKSDLTVHLCQQTSDLARFSRSLPACSKKLQGRVSKACTKQGLDLLLGFTCVEQPGNDPRMLEAAAQIAEITSADANQPSNLGIENDDTSWNHLDWEERIDPGSGRVYYANRVTKRTQWHKPTAAANAPGGHDQAHMHSELLLTHAQWDSDLPTVPLPPASQLALPVLMASSVALFAIPCADLRELSENKSYFLVGRTRNYCFFQLMCENILCF